MKFTWIIRHNLEDRNASDSLGVKSIYLKSRPTQVVSYPASVLLHKHKFALVNKPKPTGLIIPSKAKFRSLFQRCQTDSNDQCDLLFVIRNLYSNKKEVLLLESHISLLCYFCVSCLGSKYTWHLLVNNMEIEYFLTLFMKYMFRYWIYYICTLFINFSFRNVIHNASIDSYK